MQLNYQDLKKYMTIGNLPDKEFRYLRTVIVTAAVYWGFNSMLLLRWHHTHHHGNIVGMVRILQQG